MKSNLLKTTLLCLAGAVAGAGLGWGLRGAFAPSDLKDTDSGVAMGSPGSNIPDSSSGGKQHTSGNPEATPLSAGAPWERHPGALRWIRLLGAAETARAEDMPRLLRLAGDDRTVLRILALRWTELDAPHLFRHLRGIANTGGAAYETLRDVLFEEWPKRDPEAAVAALGDVSALPGVIGLRKSLITQITKTDPERSLRLLKEWEINSYTPDMKPLDAWAAKDPRKAAELALQGEGESYPFQEAVKRIGAVWAASDPATALQFAKENRGPLSAHLMSSVMSEWAKRDPFAAMEYVGAQGDSIVRGILGGPLVAEWAKTDPQGAMTWAAENLKGEARIQAAAAAVKSMAEKDVGTAADYVSEMEPGGLKNRAAAQLAEAWLRDMWTASTTPENRARVSAALEWMSALTEADAREQAFHATAWGVFPKYVDEALAFLKSDSGERAPREFFDNAARHLARNDPEAALKWTEGLSAERRLSARQSVLSVWLSSRPEAALEWVRGLPERQERRAALETVQANLPDGRTRVRPESLPVSEVTPTR